MQKKYRHGVDARITISVVPHDGHETTVIECGLRQALESELAQSANAAITVVAKSGNDEIVGGLTATISYGWVHVVTLWVADDYRHKCIGTALLRVAEQRAIDMQCHGAWLDTSNPMARNFYVDRGFEVFGKLSNEGLGPPPAHRRWFLRKLLA